MKKPGNESGSALIGLVMVVLILAIVGAVYYAVTTSREKALSDQTTARNHFLAQSNIDVIASALETFYATKKYYPSDIAPATLGDVGIVVDNNVQAAPQNTKYVYIPYPAGCTTAAKSCTSYSLSAVDVVTNVNLKTDRAKSGS